MASTLNKCFFIGRLTKDPDLRHVDGGKAVVKFSLAVNRRVKGGGDEALFVDIVAWERLAETCAQYLKKGSTCLIEGRLAIRKYENKDGEKRSATEIIASDMQMLDRKPESADSEEEYEDEETGS